MLSFRHLKHQNLSTDEHFIHDSRIIFWLFFFCHQGGIGVAFKWSYNVGEIDRVTQTHLISKSIIISDYIDWARCCNNSCRTESQNGMEGKGRVQCVVFEFWLVGMGPFSNSLLAQNRWIFLVHRKWGFICWDSKGS